jgi:hypothetical protein
MGGRGAEGGRGRHGAVELATRFQTLTGACEALLRWNLVGRHGPEAQLRAVVEMPSQCRPPEHGLSSAPGAGPDGRIEMNGGRTANGPLESGSLDGTLLGRWIWAVMKEGAAQWVNAEPDSVARTSC